MLPITRKMKRLSVEISEVIGALKDVQYILRNIEKGKSFRDKLEPYCEYVSTKSKLCMLADDSMHIADTLRKVYKCKMSANTAYREIDEAIKELLIVRAGIMAMEEETTNCDM